MNSTPSPRDPRKATSPKERRYSLPLDTVFKLPSAPESDALTAAAAAPEISVQPPSAVVSATQSTASLFPQSSPPRSPDETTGKLEPPMLANTRQAFSTPNLGLSTLNVPGLPPSPVWKTPPQEKPQAEPSSSSPRRATRPPPLCLLGCKECKIITVDYDSRSGFGFTLRCETVGAFTSLVCLPCT